MEKERITVTVEFDLDITPDPQTGYSVAELAESSLKSALFFAGLGSYGVDNYQIVSVEHAP